MPGKFLLGAAGTGNTASLIQHDGRDVGLLAYSHPAYLRDYEVNYLSHPTYGRDMTTAVSAGGNEFLIHNGGDTTAWTGSTLVGDSLTGNFNDTSSGAYYTGSAGFTIKGTVRDGFTYAFTGAPLNTGTYERFRAAVKITRWSIRDVKNVTVEFFLNDTSVSAELNLSDYLDTTYFNSWQFIDIPLSDFSVSSSNIDQIRIKLVDQGSGNPPRLFMDDVLFFSSGSSEDVIEYSWYPDNNSKHHLIELRLLALSSASTNLDSSLFFGLPELVKGIEIVYRDDAKVYTSITVRSLFDLMSWGEVDTKVFGSNSNATIQLSLKIPDYLFEIDGTNNARLVIRVRDNVSGLSKFNCAVTTAKERK